MTNEDMIMLYFLAGILIVCFLVTIYELGKMQGKRKATHYYKREIDKQVSDAINNMTKSVNDRCAYTAACEETISRDREQIEKLQAENDKLKRKVIQLQKKG